jgi:hypothetical protein
MLHTANATKTRNDGQTARLSYCAGQIEQLGWVRTWHVVVDSIGPSMTDLNQ